ncbi:hypothetical protein CDO73_14125 [Saccharibacillus sp. O23]|uniref:cation diffusion facilitator family transporter n=1 Tax=Saccharibacillus sp. O23 TaxID=2009338 RepID=UPI000B4E41CA|nr:cation transporter [Saccharibacillus sp. O23]OWR29335.1 hypothetical protein CDO73_14125 [Saccharibacillus sp. O23]
MTVRQQNIEKSASRTDVFMLGAAALIKGIGGWIGGSPALLADALNSAVDAVRGSGERAVRPSGKRKALVKMLLATLILVGAIEAVISGIGRLMRDPGETADVRAVAAFFAAVVLGEALFLLRYRSLNREQAETARQYATEHRFSLYASMLVAVGMALSVAGVAFEIPELIYADSAVSLLVAVLAIVKALRLMLQVFDESPTAAQQGEADPAPFVETVQRVRGVIEVRELHAFRSNDTVKIELILSVNPRMTVREAEEVAQRSRDLLLHRFVQVVEVSVRIEPYQTGYPYKSNDDLLGSSEEPTIIQ